MRSYSHGGADAGFRSIAVWLPEKKFGISVLGIFAECSPGPLASRAARIWLGLDPESRTTKVEKQATQKATPQLSAETLDRYVGPWVIHGQIPMRVWREGTKLMAEAMSQPTQHLVPVNDSTFHAADADAVVRFRVQGDGKATRAELRISGRPMRAERRDGAQAIELRDYVGTYASRELDVRERAARSTQR